MREMKNRLEKERVSFFEKKTERERERKREHERESVEEIERNNNKKLFFPLFNFFSLKKERNKTFLTIR